MTQKLAVAVVAAAVLAIETAFLHVVVASPLASAIGESLDATRATFEESIIVVAPRPAAKAKGG